VLENRETSAIFEHERKELSGDWRIPHNEELRDLYSSPIRWARHVARTGEKRNTADKLEKDHLEDPNIEGKIIIKWTLQK
jgi:hypothetical protein